MCYALYKQVGHRNEFALLFINVSVVSNDVRIIENDSEIVAVFSPCGFLEKNAAFPGVQVDGLPTRYISSVPRAYWRHPSEGNPSPVRTE